MTLPIAPTYHVHWSMKQSRTIRTAVFANLKATIGGKLRYAVNKVSHINPVTPLKLADCFNIPGVFKLNSIKPAPPPGAAVLSPSVMGFTIHDFVEVIFQNNENSLQSWHLDGYDFWSVGFGGGQWNSALRKKFYNMNDATSRYTVQIPFLIQMIWCCNLLIICLLKIWSLLA